jgi:ferritin
MNANRLSKTITNALNAQMTKEVHASQIYLSYAAWAERQGFGSIANFSF